jgi:hypothetical protein
VWCHAACGVMLPDLRQSCVSHTVLGRKRAYDLDGHSKIFPLVLATTHCG